MKFIFFLLILLFESSAHKLRFETMQLKSSSESVIHKVNRMRGYTIIGVETAVSDLDKIKAQNVNVVKWMLYHTESWSDETNFNEYQTWLSKELDKLDTVLNKAQQLNIKVIIELMDVPGGRYADGSQRLFYNAKFNNQFVQVWRQIAKRYNANSALYGYGLLNEAVNTKKLPIVYNNIKTQSRAAKAIRKIDTLTPLIFSSVGWDNPNPFFSDTLPFNNAIYEVHNYEPHEYTHQGVLNLNRVKQHYPGYISGWNSYFDKNKLKSVLQTVRKFQLEHNAKILVGEFSVVRWAGGGDQYLKDCITIFEEYDWDWLYHCWTDEQIWGLAYWSLDCKNGSLVDNPSRTIDTTDRKRVILDAFSSNSFTKPKNDGSTEIEKLKLDHGRIYTNSYLYQTMDNLHIYPNPANDHLYISSNSFEYCSSLRFILYHGTGQKVEEDNIASRCEGKTLTININSLTAGLYYLKISAGKSMILKKVIIQ